MILSKFLHTILKSKENFSARIWLRIKGIQITKRLMLICETINCRLHAISQFFVTQSTAFYNVIFYVSIRIATNVFF